MAALWSLACASEDARHTITEQDGVKVMLDLIRSRRTPEVVEQAVGTIGNLTWGSPERSVLDSPLVRVLKAAVRSIFTPLANKIPFSHCAITYSLVVKP